MAPTFTTAEWLQVARFLDYAEALLTNPTIPEIDRQYTKSELARVRTLRSRILDSDTAEPSKLRPTGDAYRDTLVSERLAVRSNG